MAHIWVDLQVVLAIHDEQIAEHGGASGVRDRGLLESALARPQNLLAYGESDLADLAVAYTQAIARNHPFVDGNKRTAWAVAETFIELNGHEIDADDASIYPEMLALAEGRIEEWEFAAWLRARCKSRKS